MNPIHAGIIGIVLLIAGVVLLISYVRDRMRESSKSDS